MDSMEKKKKERIYKNQRFFRVCYMQLADKTF